MRATVDRPRRISGSPTSAVAALCVVVAAAAAAAGCVAFTLPVNPKTLAEVPPVTFDAGAFWYQADATAASVDPDSATYIDQMAGSYGDRLVMVMKNGSVPVYHADASTPRVSIAISGSLWSNGRRVAGMKNVPMPDYAVPDFATDGHLAVIDAAAGLEFDFWQLRKISGRWVASIGAIFDLSSDGVHSEQAVRASGFALTAGMIWPEELMGAGTIDHALAMGYAHTKKDSFVAPATSSDGWDSAAYALPMGAHLRLDPAFDINAPELGLNAYEKKIAAAMQQYGMYIHDTNNVGSIIELEAVNPLSFSDDPYETIPGMVDHGYKDGYVTLSANLVKHFQVIQLPAVQDKTASTTPSTVAHEEYYYFWGDS